jgi:hypothetical protein
MASNEALLLDILSQSHKVEKHSFLCNSPKSIIACLVPMPILKSHAFSLKDFFLDCVVGDNNSAPPFHVAEIPLLLGLLGLLGDLLYSSVDVEIIAVGERIHWRVNGGFFDWSRLDTADVNRMERYCTNVLLACLAKVRC